jgi:hypothetical protein
MLSIHESAAWLGNAQIHGLILGQLDDGEVAVSLKLRDHETEETARELYRTAPRNWRLRLQLGDRNFPDDFA